MHHHLRSDPANIYLFKVNNRNTRKRCEVCSNLKTKIPERRCWSRPGVFIVIFKHISHLFLVLLLLTLTLNKYMLAGKLPLNPWTHDVHWTHIRRSKDVQRTLMLCGYIDALIQIKFRYYFQFYQSKLTFHQTMQTKVLKKHTFISSSLETLLMTARYHSSSSYNAQQIYVENLKWIIKGNLFKINIDPSWKSCNFFGV